VVYETKEKEVMAKKHFIVWNVSERRQEVGSLFPSREDAEAAIERLRGSRASEPASLVHEFAAVAVPV
jgi:hypothetical protein